ncbi:hypothetical protein [Nitrosomonas sp. Nm166]|uniref:hypothetical protein n=1 Tax=Nitrosomonas sp. Nm166 TaxID=1881054 RepID=UPI0008EED776|nr:hypothetical protein [Nitrosomonas sp. Nm166]SFE58971.1 hypothetical protein SAMN05428977_102142 [Nitrosomonas sp. Nm166]
MDSTEKRRKLLLGGALIATLVAVVLVEEEGEESTIDTVQPIQSARSPSDKVKAQAGHSEYLDVSKLGQRKFNPSAGELFVSTTWAPKQPPISLEEQAAKAEQMAKEKASAPPSAPTAPPLQFKYTGKAIADNTTWVFLSQSGENHIAKIGTKINDKYRLDSINDDAITLTYLPLNIKQTLTINNKIAGNFR